MQLRHKLARLSGIFVRESEAEITWTADLKLLANAIIDCQPLLDVIKGKLVGDIPSRAASTESVDDPVAPRYLVAAPGYEQLAEVFRAAHDQAAYGKGKERHGHSGVPFHEQRMQVASDAVGSPDGMVYQVIKKTTEGLEFSNPDKREHELLGALNYLAGVIIWLRRHETSNQGEV